MPMPIPTRPTNATGTGTTTTTTTKARTRTRTTTIRARTATIPRSTERWTPPPPAGIITDTPVPVEQHPEERANAEADADAETEARAKLERVFAQRNNFPPLLWGTIDRALFDSRTKKTPPEELLRFIEGKLSDLLWENHTYQKIDASKGLSIFRDTEAQVETAARCFPAVLSSRNEDGLAPIRAQVTNKRQTCNVLAVPFVPILARVGIEEGVFADWERGGLIDTEERDNSDGIDNGSNDSNDSNGNNNNNKGSGNHYSLYWNVLEALAIGQHHATYPGKERLRLVDQTCLSTLKRLRDMGLFRKEDITKYHLIHRTVSPGLGLLERQFRWLADWDPSSLLGYWRGCLPIHLAAYDYTWHSINRERFRTIFALGLDKFPVAMGGLFHTDANGITPYRRIGRVCGGEALDAVFARAHHRNHHVDVDVDIDVDIDVDVDDDAGGVNALLECLVFAATEPLVHLDGVLLVLRRILEIEPSVLYQYSCASATTRTGTAGRLPTTTTEEQPPSVAADDDQGDDEGDDDDPR